MQPAPEPIRVTRVAAYALCTDGDAILLTRNAPGATVSHDGYWTLPGGGVEFGEAPERAVLRELAEETGLAGAVIGLAGVDSWADQFTDPADGVAKDFHGIRIMYRVRITGGELRDEVDGSSDAARWIQRAEAGRMPLVDIAEAGIRLAFDD